MGESFKLHAQALCGYETALLAESQAAGPALTPHHNLEVAAY